MSAASIRRERLRREAGERLIELRSAPLGRAAVAGVAVAAAGGLLRRPREGALAGLAAAIAVGSARADAAMLERAHRNGEDLASIAPRLGEQLSHLGNWAVDADFARLVAQEAERGPGLVVELGSGLSTQLVASILAERGAGRLVSVDHDASFAAASAARLGRDAGERADVVVAPLREQTLGGASSEWYDAEAVLAALPDEPIDLLVVDGPPATSTWTRWPAIEVLGPRLAPGAVVLLDDGRRRHERATALRWAREHPELKLCWQDTLKGAWRLEKAGAPAESAPRRVGRRLLRLLNPSPSGFGRWPVRR
jgi:predicted O-methyltransferase YrrM